MPELPEVETIVADLRPHLTGRTIVSCELPFPTIVRHPEPEVFIDSVAGMRIAGMRRRGKFILIELDGDQLLVVHLGMTGQLRIVDAAAPIEKHTHAIFTLDDGRQLRYRDPRRFGRLLLGSSRPKFVPPPRSATIRAAAARRLRSVGVPRRAIRLKRARSRRGAFLTSQSRTSSNKRAS